MMKMARSTLFLFVFVTALLCGYAAPFKDCAISTIRKHDMLRLASLTESHRTLCDGRLSQISPAVCGFLGCSGQSDGLGRFEL